MSTPNTEILEWSYIRSLMMHVRMLETNRLVDREGVRNFDVGPLLDQLEAWGLPLETELDAFNLFTALSATYLSYSLPFNDLRRTQPWISPDEISRLRRLTNELYAALAWHLEPFIPDEVSIDPHFQSVAERPIIDPGTLSWSAGRLSTLDRAFVRRYWHSVRLQDPERYNVSMRSLEDVQEYVRITYQSDPIYIFAQFVLPIVMEQTIRRYAFRSISEEEVMYLLYRPTLLNRHNIGLGLPEPIRSLVIP